MKTFGLENVKAFKDTGDIELTPITIFVGQNSCGKSSFIRFPVVLSQSYLDGTFPICLHSDRSNLVDYGSYEDVLHNHTGNSFSCKLSYNYNCFPTTPFYSQYLNWLYSIFQRFDTVVKIEGVSKGLKVSEVFCEEMLEKDVHVIISYSQDFNTKTLITSSYKILFGNELAFIIYYDISSEKYVFQQFKTVLQNHIVDCKYSISLKSDNNVAIDLTEGLAEIIGNSIGSSDIETIHKRLRHEFSSADSLMGDPLEYVLEGIKYGKDDYNTLVKRCGAFTYSLIIKQLIDKQIEEEMENTYYIGPFRHNPERIYRRGETTVQNVGVKGEYASKMLVNGSIEPNNIIEEVSKWFKDAFDYELIIEHLSNEYYQIILKDNITKTRSNIMDVGYGVSQVLPIVSQIAKATLNDLYDDDIVRYGDELFIIEQPELHLHPAAQSKLADLFVNALSNDAVDYRKFLIETHSEHLIRALQVLIADPNCFLTNKMVKFYYVDKGEDGSVIKEMKTNEYGQFVERWPKGFFDEAHIMSRKLMDVVAERKNAEETSND